jgi:agmatinase
MKEFFYPQLEPFNFLGLDGQDYEKSKVVVFPVPYSSTTYWKAGTKEGPQAIIEASRHIELYDAQTKKDVSKDGIFTLPFLEPSKNSPKETIERIEGAIDGFLQDKKFTLMLGGEHSITFGAVSSLKKKFSDFSVLQIDAHSDLRDEFEGTKYHHACVMRRVRELAISTTQVGIRSISKEESEYVEKENIKNIFFAPEIPIEQIVDSLKENVYLTFDLDAFDTSIMPSTGTPEPGGLEWYPVLNLIKEVAKKKKIVGADVVELDPIPGIAAPDFLAAKLVYKIINYIFNK